MIGLFLNHLQTCKATCLVIVPDIYDSWYPVLAQGLRAKEIIATTESINAFWQFSKGKLLQCAPVTNMAAVLLCFD